MHMTLSGGVHGVGVCVGPIGFFAGLSFVGEWLALGASCWYEAGVFSLKGVISKVRGDIFLYHRFPALQQLEKDTGVIVIADHRVLEQEKDNG